MIEQIKFFGIKRTNKNREHWVSLKCSCPVKYFDLECITLDYSKILDTMKYLKECVQKSVKKENLTGDEIDVFRIVELDLVEVNNDLMKAITEMAKFNPHDRTVKGNDK